LSGQSYGHQRSTLFLGHHHFANKRICKCELFCSLCSWTVQHVW